MFLNKNKMARMEEAYIAEQYSRYLQRVTIVAIRARGCTGELIDQTEFLSYSEFKEYYILNLVGKGDKDYINKLVNKIQRQNLVA